MALPIVSQKLPNSTSTKSIALFARWACLQSAMSSDTLEAERHKKNKFAVAVLLHIKEKHYSHVCTVITLILSISYVTEDIS